MQYNSTKFVRESVPQNISKLEARQWHTMAV